MCKVQLSICFSLLVTEVKGQKMLPVSAMLL